MLQPQIAHGTALRVSVMHWRLGVILYTVRLLNIKACVTWYLNSEYVVYLEVLVIAEHLDIYILFCHFSKKSKIVFENENFAIFAGNSQKDSCPPHHRLDSNF